MNSNQTITKSELMYDLVFDINRCSFNITNIILIDSSVSQFQQFVNSVNDSTLPIVYSRHSSTDKLIDILNNENLINVKRVAFVFNNDLLEYKYFIDNKGFFTDNDLLPETLEQDYSLGLQNVLNIIRNKQLTNIDFLACSSLVSDNWKAYYNLLANKTGVIVGASNNKTGNIAYGADWLLESTHEDIKNIYWSDAIDNYSSSLDVVPFSNTAEIIVDNVSYPFIAENTSNCIFKKDTDAKTLIQQRSFKLTTAVYGSTNVPLIDFRDGVDAFNINGTGGWFLDGNGFSIDLSGLGDTPFYSLVRSGDDTIYTVNNIKIVGDLSDFTLASTIYGIIVSSNEHKVIMNNCYIHSTGDLTSSGIIGSNLGYLGKVYINNCGVAVDGNFSIVGYGGGIAGMNVRDCYIDKCYVYTKGNITINGGGIMGGVSSGSISNCFVKSLGTIYILENAGGIVADNDNGSLILSNCAILAPTIDMTATVYPPVNPLFPTMYIVNTGTGGIIGKSNGNATINNCAFLPTNVIQNGSYCGAIIGTTKGVNNINNCYSSYALKLFGISNIGFGYTTYLTNCYTPSFTFGTNALVESYNIFINCVYGGATNINKGLYNISIFNSTVFNSGQTLSSWNDDWIMPSDNRPVLKVFQNKLWIDAYKMLSDRQFITTDNNQYNFIDVSGDCIFLLDINNYTLTQQRNFKISSASYAGITDALIDFTGGYNGYTNATGASWVLDGNDFTIDLTDLGSTTFYSLVKSSDNTLYSVNNIKIVGDLSNLTLQSNRGIIVSNYQKYVIMNNCYIHSSDNLSTSNIGQINNGGTMIGAYTADTNYGGGEVHINNCGVSVDGNFTINTYGGGIVGFRTYNTYIDTSYVYVKGDLIINEGGGIAGVYCKCSISNCFVKSLQTIYINDGGGIADSSDVISNCAILAPTINMISINIIPGGIVGQGNCIINNCAFIPINVETNGSCGAIIGRPQDCSITNCYSSVNLPLAGGGNNFNTTTWTNCYTPSSTFASSATNNTFNYCVYGGATNANGLYNLDIFTSTAFNSGQTLATWNNDWIMPSDNRPILKVFNNSSWSWDDVLANLINLTFSSNISTATVDEGTSILYTVTKTQGTPTDSFTVNFTYSNGTINPLVFQISDNSKTFNLTAVAGTMSVSIVSIVSNNNYDTFIYTPSSLSINVITAATGSAGGDPYITTLENQEFYKLPGKIRNYRLFQSKNCVINASVSPIKARDAENLLRAFKDVEGFVPKTDGFYFDSYYIQIGNDYVHFNERIELVSVSDNLEFMYIKTYPEVQTENINGMSSTYFLTEILVQDSSCNNVLIQLKRDLNPQIVNGISIRVGDKIKNTTGALVRRSNPRNYEIKELKSVKLVNETKYPTSKNYHVKKETFYSKQVVGLKIN